MSLFNQSYIGLRNDLLKHVKGCAESILDVGCASGVNGKYLLDKGIASTVYGIEYDDEMSSIAEKSYTKIFRGDLNSEIFRKIILDDAPQFDYILFGDILEHLVYPLKVLNELKALLKPKGKVIISLPNIAHIELFIQVYFKGTFPQNSRGIFDKTHLRWFTKKDAYKLIEDSELKIIRYERNYRSRDAIGSKFDWKYKLLRLIDKDLVTFQHIIVCEHV
ncbi:MULTISPECIES: class I SAM-dependent methyltransferase [Flavobacteriaceae]|uniref:Class I SAM-dependent methyltransferase n=2 Tax=Flavobacteriaceae TaxID=49546 RepID=A0A4Y8AVP7_9FLAO|nr:MULTISPECIES: class I SAM-dependent methyltransferase [Flavobacteriaceae]TEW76571.1 class I SAM-dependent methyltransferase [Gramella jeungdoensis]GGK54088.1 SAM-dependent methyltransferase [Lutibacter litoralis]